MSAEFTVLDVMNLEPCEEYTFELVTALWGGKQSLTIQEIAALSIPVNDRVWALIGFASERTVRLLMCWCAKRALCSRGGIWWAVEAALAAVQESIRDEENGGDILRDVVREITRKEEWDAILADGVLAKLVELMESENFEIHEVG